MTGRVGLLGKVPSSANRNDSNPSSSASCWWWRESVWIMAALIFPGERCTDTCVCPYHATNRRNVKAPPGQESSHVDEACLNRFGVVLNLPGAERASNHPNRILRYLLDSSNPASRGKPALFLAMGCSRLSWGRLSDDLLIHGQTHPVSSVTSDNGNRSTTYTIDGDLVGPNGRVHRIRTVWRVDGLDADPRFITAFPPPRARLTSIGGRSSA